LELYDAASSNEINSYMSHLALDARAAGLLFTEARTSNTFADEPVSDQQLRAIADVAKWPPTMANIDPLRLLFLRSAERKE